VIDNDYKIEIFYICFEEKYFFMQYVKFYINNNFKAKANKAFLPRSGLLEQVAARERKKRAPHEQYIRLPQTPY
jgi:hypothetical protein